MAVQHRPVVERPRERFASSSSIAASAVGQSYEIRFRGEDKAKHAHHLDSLAHHPVSLASWSAKSPQDVRNRSRLANTCQRIASGQRHDPADQRRSAPRGMVNIRKFTVRANHLEDLIQLGMLTPQAARFLEAAVISGLNVLVAGGVPRQEDG